MVIMFGFGGCSLWCFQTVLNYTEKSFCYLAFCHFIDGMNKIIETPQFNAIKSIHQHLVS